MALATELARKKWRSVHSLPREVAYRRMAGALARKGYAPGLAFEVVRGVLDDHGTGDDGLLEEPESL